MSQALVVVSVISGVVGLLGIVAFALAYVRGAYNKATIEALRGDLEDYKRRDDLKDKEIIELKARTGQLETKLQHLTDVREILREEVTQRAAVDELKVQEKANHVELCEAIGGLKNQEQANHLEQMGALRSIRGAIEGTNES